MSLADQVNKKLAEISKLRQSVNIQLNQVEEICHSLQSILPPITCGSYTVKFTDEGDLGFFIGESYHPGVRLYSKDVRALYEFLQEYFEDRLPE